MSDQATQNPEEPWPQQLERLREMGTPDSDWDLSRNDRDAIRAVLRRLNEWKSLCVIEVACDNPSVDSYMREWEGRALKAEAQFAEQARTLETLHRLVNAAVSTRDIVMDRNHKIDRYGHNPSWVKASDLLAVLDPQKP